MTKPIIAHLTDGSQAAIWPATGRATVARYGAGAFDLDREPCAAGDFAGKLIARRHLQAEAAETKLMLDFFRSDIVGQVNHG